MVGSKKNDFRVGLLVGGFITAAGILSLTGYLGALGYASYTDMHTKLQECRKKAGELEQKVQEKEKTPPNQTSPYFRPEWYQHCREK